ncbi:hypothetical protein STSP2_00687 [Anaerohalosphaera lusitana]|uniref:Lipoprotein n=1 Tax=Anaerohalosphaera lusitana TaxID=1936003 RepID=A0A1U9NHY3_9BACT|nr:DUF6786 family protein [Anaerohalosphaera lusitana]AQT67539.1 hypothetical protein STSP2_00687 [Anaerohalosphaera lusitana]
MKLNLIVVPVLVVVALLTGCSNSQTSNERTFGEDVAFLKDHTETVVLSDSTGQAKIAIVPAYQGRVMTSTAGGDNGASYGFLKYDLIASGETKPHINPYGGEDRFWLGPEGGQYSIFFEPGDPFDLEHWQTPAFIDTEKYEVAVRKDNSVTFIESAELTNYSGTSFEFGVFRQISLIERPLVTDFLGIAIPDSLDVVAFQSSNMLTNQSSTEWTKKDGLLSIWILGMFKHGPKTTVVAPFHPGSKDKLGPIVNDAYFGKVPNDRLTIKDGTVFFLADGQYRSKIGLNPMRAKPVVGSYDPDRKVLTIVQYTKPAGATDYVNSMWEIQEQPYGGDAVNAYNDGPAEPGAEPFGPFYELETSSPAAALAPNESLSHTHRTFHITGPENDLDPIARAILGVSLEQIKNAI